MKKYIVFPSLKEAMIFAFIGLLVAIFYLYAYQKGYLCPGWLTEFVNCIEDKEPIKTALGFAGAFLVIVNTSFIVIRIRRTDKQIEEAERANFLSTLNNGVNMLYSDKFITQIGGIEYLHNLAETHKSDLEKVEKVFEILRIFVKKSPVDKEKINEEKMLEDVVIKQEILYKIRPPEDNVYSGRSSKIDLRGAELYKACLPGDKVCLKNADLREAHLEGADLQKTNLSGAKLQKAKLQCFEFLDEHKYQYTNLDGAILTNANLEGACLKGADLEGARLHNIILENASLGCWTSEKYDLRKGQTSFKRAELKGVILIFVTLPKGEIDWSDSHLNYTLMWEHDCDKICKLNLPKKYPIRVGSMSSLLWAWKEKKVSGSSKESLIEELKEEAASNTSDKEIIEGLIKQMRDPKRLNTE